jgi:ubiquinone/menaquinone biosynthesis C-methylase UbiE
MTPTKTIDDVHDFWNTQACGTHFIEVKGKSAEFFEKFREFRYRTEWHIPLLVPFEEGRDKDLLEIGCGNGADGAIFADHGARYTGVDLTEEAVESTREHFRALGFEGRFEVGNAERLRFEDESFDMVYSHGVLHHMPDPQRGIDEAFRLLRPGGRAVVMLYHRRSFNYYCRIMGYMRLRVLLGIVGRIGRWSRDRKERASRPPSAIQGNSDRRIWELHYDGFLREGWSYLRAGSFVHHATDGPECPYAYAYSRSDMKRLFSRYSNVTTRIAHFPIRKYSPTRWVPFPVERFLATRFGWYLFIYADKPQ